MTEYISRQTAIDSIDPDGILPDWMVEYVKTQLRGLPVTSISDLPERILDNEDE